MGIRASTQESGEGDKIQPVPPKQDELGRGSHLGESVLWPTDGRDVGWFLARLSWSAAAKRTTGDLQSTGRDGVADDWWGLVEEQLLSW